MNFYMSRLPVKFSELPDNGILCSLQGSEEDRLQQPGERGSSGCRRRPVASGPILKRIRSAGASLTVDTAGRQYCSQRLGAWPGRVFAVCVAQEINSSGCLSGEPARGKCCLSSTSFLFLSVYLLSLLGLLSLQDIKALLYPLVEIYLWTLHCKTTKKGRGLVSPTAGQMLRTEA